MEGLGNGHWREYESKCHNPTFGGMPITKHCISDKKLSHSLWLVWYQMIL